MVVVWNESFLKLIRLENRKKDLRRKNIVDLKEKARTENISEEDITAKEKEGRDKYFSDIDEKILLIFYLNTDPNKACSREIKKIINKYKKGKWKNWSEEMYKQICINYVKQKEPDYYNYLSFLLKSKDKEKLYEEAEDIGVNLDGRHGNDLKLIVEDIMSKKSEFDPRNLWLKLSKISEDEDITRDWKSIVISASRLSLRSIYEKQFNHFQSNKNDINAEILNKENIESKLKTLNTILPIYKTKNDIFRSKNNMNETLEWIWGSSWTIAPPSLTEDKVQELRKSIESSYLKYGNPQKMVGLTLAAFPESTKKTLTINNMSEGIKVGLMIESEGLQCMDCPKEADLFRINNFFNIIKSQEFANKIHYLTLYKGIIKYSN